MNDTHHITVGFDILGKYEHKGSVDADYSRSIFTGPSDLAEDEYREEDRIDLEANYWFYSEEIGRWGYHL